MTLHRLYAAEPTPIGTYTTRELSPTRVEIVRVDQPRPVQRMTQPEYDDWQLATIGEIAGQGDVIVGTPVNVRPHTQRWRNRIAKALGYARDIGIRLLAGATVMLVILGIVWALNGAVAVP